MMSKYQAQSFAAFFMLFILLTPQIAYTQESVCEALVQTALSSAREACDATGRNQACYGNVTLQAEPHAGIPLLDFDEPGDMVDLAGLQSLRLSSLNEVTNEWGVAFMRVQANLPGTLPGQNVLFILFGDVRIDNRVTMAELSVVSNSNVNVRGGPSTNAAIVNTVAPGETVAAVGRLADNSWLQVRLADQSTGWIFRDLLSSDADIDQLAIVQPDTPVFGPMQAFSVRTGINDAVCEAAPESGLLIQTPEGVGEIEFRINEVKFTIGSSLYLQGQDELVANVLDGDVTAEAFGVARHVPEGGRVRVPLSEDGVASGPPDEVEALEANDLRSLPVALLDEPIEIAPPLSDAQLAALNNEDATTDTAPSDSTPTSDDDQPVSPPPASTGGTASGGVASGDCSIAGDEPTTITFVNDSQFTLAIYWVSYDCEEVLYNTLSPGQSYVQQTFVTHPWIVRDTRTGIALASTTTRGRTTITVSDD
ncbi:MAG: hypothetical protein D6737_04325 [Chloroflexi bacterium]|nr:MAG: hypothetical protein D6737_04325 [Chloroflexota bacterium]